MIWDNNERERKQTEKLRPEVVTLYAKAKTLLASDRVLFDTPINE
jgi:hypothetical protein